MYLLAISARPLPVLTGYVREGVSLVGTKKDYPVIIDESTMEFGKIFVSEGMR